MNSKIVLYKGKRGSGKTLTMTKDGLKYHFNGVRVYRNFNAVYGTYISDEDILKLDKHSKLINCVLMIDEIQIFFDSRRSMAKQNILFSNFIQQIRKRNIILLGTTQFSNTIDLRLRQHVDIIVKPKFIKEYNVCEAVYIDLTTMEDESLGVPFEVKIVYDPTPIFKMYNTNEMIK